MAGIMGLLTVSSNLVYSTRRLSQNGASKAVLDRANVEEPRGQGWKGTWLHWRNANSKDKRQGIENPAMVDDINLEPSERGWKRASLHWPISNGRPQGMKTEANTAMMDSIKLKPKERGWRRKLLPWPIANSKGKSQGIENPVMMEDINLEPEEKSTLLHWPITKLKRQDSSETDSVILDSLGKGTDDKDNVKLEPKGRGWKRALLHWPLTKLRRQDSKTDSVILGSKGKGTDRKGWKRLFQWPFRKAESKDSDVLVSNVRRQGHSNGCEGEQLRGSPQKENSNWKRHGMPYGMLDSAKESQKTRLAKAWLTRPHRRTLEKGRGTSSAIPENMGQKANKKGWKNRLLHWPIRKAKDKRKEKGTIRAMFGKMKDGSKRRRKRWQKRLLYWPIRRRRHRGRGYWGIRVMWNKRKNGSKKRKRRFLHWPIRRARSKRKEKRPIGVILEKMRRDSMRRKEKRFLHWPIRKRKSEDRGSGIWDIYGDETVLLVSGQKESSTTKIWTRLKIKGPNWLIRKWKGEKDRTHDVISYNRRVGTKMRQPYLPIVKRKRKGRKKERRTDPGDFEFDVSAEWENIRNERLKKKHVRKVSVKKENKKGLMVKDYDACYKVLLIGDTNAGKTALLGSLISEDFQAKTLPTVGMDFVSTIVEVDGARIKLQIWDTAGQERFRSMTRFQFRGTQGAILAYDISDRETFKTLEYWLKMIDSEIDQYNKEPIPVYLIGNKSDISKRQVSYKQGKQLAEEHLMRGYVETSAKTGRNVTEAFTQLGQAIIEINNPKLMDSYLDKFDRKDKYEQKKKEAEALAQYQLKKRRSRIRLPSNLSRAKSLEKRAQRCCTS